MTLTLRPLMLVTAVTAAALTLVFIFVPGDLAYRAPQAHVAIETAGSLIALLVAFILLGRFMQSGLRSDLVLVAALTMIGLTNLLFAAIPSAATTGAGAWATWAPLAGRLLGSFGFAVAACLRDERIVSRRAAVRRTAAVTGGALIFIGLLFALLASRLPLGIDPALSPNKSTDPMLVGNPTVLIVQVVQMFFFMVAAVGFLRRSERERDSLMDWFAVASVLGAFFALNYFLFPSLYSEWVYTGDFLRVGFYIVLLGGAASQIRSYQGEVIRAATLEERRRMARELHDGLAQELAFIATQSRWLSRRSSDSKGIEHLAVAAERALDESRSAISALTRPMDEPLDAALAQAAEEVAGRVGMRLELELEDGIQVKATTREALLRIVREAVNNAARHGQARVATIELSNRDGVRLVVGDDGIGFDPDTRVGAGFGLISMRERAEALGGQLQVSSEPGSGTQIEVVLP